MPWIAALDQFAVLDRAHIIGAHAFEGVAEQVELAHRREASIGAPGLGQREHRRGEAAHQTQAKQRNLLHVPFAFPKLVRRFNFSHGAGD